MLIISIHFIFSGLSCVTYPWSLLLLQSINLEWTVSPAQHPYSHQVQLVYGRRKWQVKLVLLWILDISILVGNCEFSSRRKSVYAWWVAGALYALARETVLYDNSVDPVSCRVRWGEGAPCTISGEPEGGWLYPVFGEPLHPWCESGRYCMGKREVSMLMMLLVLWWYLVSVLWKIHAIASLTVAHTDRSDMQHGA